jgi:hypothetical protein
LMMDSRKKKFLTVLCLASVLLAWRMYVLITGYVLPNGARAEIAVALPSVPSPSGTASGIPALPAPELAAVPANVLQQQAAVTEQPWGRDPFAVIPEAHTPNIASETAAKKNNNQPAAPPSALPLKFTGVSRSNGRWLAVVGGRIVRVGDELDGGFTVVEIGKRSLTISREMWVMQYELGGSQPVIRPIGGKTHE